MMRKSRDEEVVNSNRFHELEINMRLWSAYKSHLLFLDLIVTEFCSSSC